MAGKLWIDENDQLRVGRLIAVVLVVVVAVGYVFACGVAQSLDAHRDHWWWQLWAYEFTQDGAWFDVARTTATLVAIPGAAVALVIAFARHRVSQQQVAHAVEESLKVHERELARHDATERQLKQAASESRALEERELDRRINEQYVQAVNQLRDDSPVARIAGMHALDRLAQNHEKLRSIVVDVWCAYLRIRRSPERGEVRADEREVRSTCLRLLLGHLRNVDPSRFWGDDGIAIDLSRADLGDHVRAESCWFPRGTAFTHAHFGTDTDFGRASFADEVRFDEAVFGDLVSFGDEASFKRTRFGNDVWFSSATFGSDADWTDAAFGDRIRFEGTKLGSIVLTSGMKFGKNVSFARLTLGPHQPRDGGWPWHFQDPE